MIFLTLLPSATAATRPTPQERQITGVVRDMNTYRELRNVNIFIRGTGIGTTTDFSGNYALRVPSPRSDMIVVFRHIGYEPREIPLDSLARFNQVLLQPRVIPLRSVTIEEERGTQLEIERDLPQSVALLEAQEFEIRGYVDAGDLLRTDHSVQVKERLSGRKTVSIRGGNADEVVVLYNGVKMNSVYDNVFDLSLIDLTDVERFEIIKGSNTALYGPEAFSGVINIVPKVEQDYNVRFQQRLGTYRSGNWGLHLYKKLSRLQGSYSFKRGGTRRYFLDAADDGERLENRSLHHTANVNVTFAERDGRPASSLDVVYVYSSLKYENQRDNERLADSNQLQSLKYTGDIAFLKDLDLGLSLRRLEQDQFLATGTGALNRSINDRALYLNAGKRARFGLLDVLLAYQFERARLDFSDVRRNFQEQLAGLESAEFLRQHHGLVSIAKLRAVKSSGFLQIVDLGVSFRHDRVRDEQRNARLRDGTSTDPVGLFGENVWRETTFKFSVSLSGYRENLAFTGYLSFGANTKFPTLFQQVSSPAMLTTQATRPNLRPERNRSTELSFTLTRDIRGERSIYGWQISGSFFQNHYDNKFRVFATPGIPVPFYDNVPGARISGLETKSSVFFFRKKVAVELGMSRYFISEKAAFPFKSDFKRTLNITVDHAGYSFQLYLFREGEQTGWLRQPDGRFAEVTLPDYANLDLHLSKSFAFGKLKLFANASGRNLLNDREVVLQGLALRDRRFYLTVGAQY
jgi:outer membrane receptor protein involved in Fe transport